EPPVPDEKFAAAGRQSHSTGGASPRPPLEDREAGRVLELTEVAPRVPVRHVEPRHRLLQRSQLVDGLEELRTPIAELEPGLEDDPDLEPGLHPPAICGSRNTSLSGSIGSRSASW